MTELRPVVMQVGWEKMVGSRWLSSQYPAKRHSGLALPDPWSWKRDLALAAGVAGVYRSRASSSLRCHHLWPLGLLCCLQHLQGWEVFKKNPGKQKVLGETWTSEFSVVDPWSRSESGVAPASARSWEILSSTDNLRWQLTPGLFWMTRFNPLHQIMYPK